MTNYLPLSSRLYGRLLVLYPEDLRRDYGAEMALAFAEDLDTARREAGIRGAIRVWGCALGEFLRFALPGRATSSAVRVPAITLALFTGMTMGFLPGALREPFRMILVLPLFGAPFIALLSLWACRGDAIISLGCSGQAGQER
jgi:hypothetical protein